MRNQEARSIKDIIAQWPRVGEILDEYGIGCATCTVGICQLKDILTLHQLPAPSENALMLRIESEIYPERNIELPEEPGVQVRQHQQYSQPIQILVDEHSLIKRWLACILGVAAVLDLSRSDDREIATRAIDFIRNYTDRLHHGKEEAILFDGFDDTADVFQVVYRDHAAGRKLVGEMAANLDSRNTQDFCESMLAYRALLSEHIEKEDHVLFPWLDSQLDASCREKLLQRFQQANEELALHPDVFVEFIATLEARQSLALGGKRDV